MTLSIYAHTFQTAQARAADALDVILNGKQKTTDTELPPKQTKKNSNKSDNS
jgi:hypothetical protein